MRSSIRTRLLVAFLAVALTSAAGLSLYFLAELEDYGLRKLEDRLDSEALVIASSIGAQLDASGGRALTPAQAGRLSRVYAAISPQIQTRIRVLDHDGVAVADSGGYDAIGTPYAERPEVRAALGGDRGATTRITEDRRVALYVAYPIVSGGEIAGVAYTSSSTFSIRTLLRDYRARLLGAVAAFIALAFAFTEVLSRWLSRPLRELADGASAFASGDHTVRVRPSGSRETRAVASAFNAMADEVNTVLSELEDEERRRSRFISDVSHELRTPLTAIRGAAETLLDGDMSDEDERQFLSTIARESERLTRLANDLLTLQRIEGATGELPISRVDLGAVALRAIEGLAPLTDGRGVHVALDGGAPPVLGDRDRLQQVLGNLIDNASRMTPEGGVVSVRLSAENGSAVVRVSDQGPGIPEADLPHIFERFYRAQTSRARASGGAGLGLAIVAAIVRAHGGTVAATSAADGGSVFTVSLPAIREL